MGKKITMKHDGYSTCPDCGEKLVYQEKWDKEFDRYADKLPSIYYAIEALKKDGEPKYICCSCDLQIVVSN